MKTETTLSEFYEKWVSALMADEPSVAAMDRFNADIQRSIEVPHRDAAVKTELAQLKLKAARWFHNKSRNLAT